VTRCAASGHRSEGPGRASAESKSKSLPHLLDTLLLTNPPHLRTSPLPNLVSSIPFVLDLVAISGHTLWRCRCRPVLITHCCRGCRAGASCGTGKGDPPSTLCPPMTVGARTEEAPTGGRAVEAAAATATATATAGWAGSVVGRRCRRGGAGPDPGGRREALMLETLVWGGGGCGADARDTGLGRRRARRCLCRSLMLLALGSEVIAR
jgi:hypothetical protein